MRIGVRPIVNQSGIQGAVSWITSVYMELKMARRTLKTCWKQYEKLSQGYLGSDDEEKREDILDKLDTLSFKANGDRIGDALVALFVRPYIQQPTSLLFSTDVSEGVPEWQTMLDSEEGQLIVHPISVFQFINLCRTTEVTPEMHDDFLRSRYLSFLMEIGKLPSIYILFLLVLQRVAYTLEVAHLEKRGGVIEIAEGEPYHTLLWAFKELEVFSRNMYGINIRAHFGISWYEADWITGR